MQPMPPGTPVYVQAAAPRNTMALVSLIAGLLSFCSVLCCCIPVLNWGAFLAMLLFGLLALITGIIGLGTAKQTGQGRTEATVGMVLGVFWLVAAILGAVLFFMGCASLGALGAAGAAVDGSGGSAPVRPPPSSDPSWLPTEPDPTDSPPLPGVADPSVAAGGVAPPLGEPSEVWLDAPCTPLSIYASRELSTGHRGEYYPVTNAFDGDSDTAWAVRDPVPGGDWIEATFAPGTRVSRVWLTTGYEKIGRAGDLFVLNAHLSRFTLATDTGSRSRDVGASERSAEVRLNAETTRVRITMDGIYPGERWQDLSISEITIYCAR